MKKLLFTAMALVACSGISMANNRVATKTNCKQEAISKEEKEVRLIISRCDIIYIRTLQLAILQDFSNEDASAIALAAFQTCSEIEANN